MSYQLRRCRSSSRCLHAADADSRLRLCLRPSSVRRCRFVNLSPAACRNLRRIILISLILGSVADAIGLESTIDPSLTMSNLDFSHIPLDQLGQFLEGPALDPPRGVEPNFQHPENQNGPALFVCIFGLVVSTVVLLARFCVRIFYLRKGHVVDGKLRNPFGALLLTCSPNIAASHGVLGLCMYTIHFINV
jgi:hypothetical protein